MDNHHQWLFDIDAFNDGLRVVEVTVGTSSKSVGKFIKDVDVPKSCTFAMITRGDELIPPRGDTEVRAGDLITVVGKPDAVLKITRYLRGE